MIHREAIRQKHWRHWVQEAMAGEHEPFAFDRSKASGAWTHMHERARGVRRATPDTQLVVAGYPSVWCEWKAPGERPTDEQQALGERLIALGRLWLWSTTIYRYYEFLHHHGFPLQPNAAFLAMHRDARADSEIAAAELKAGKLPGRLKAHTPKPTPAKVRAWRRAVGRSRPI